MRQDAHYEEKGATLVDEVWSSSDVIVKIDGPTEDEVKKLGSKHLIAQCNARINPDLIKSMNANGATVLSQDMLMRTLSRGQAFDVLSSQANIAGSAPDPAASQVLLYSGFLCMNCSP